MTLTTQKFQLTEDLTTNGADPKWLAVIRAIEHLNAAETFGEIQHQIARAARSLVGADGVTFVLREGAMCHYVEENAIGPLWKGQRFPMTACISGWSMMNAAVAIAPDVYADPRIPVEAYEPTFVRSLIMTPVGQDPPVAAIGAYWSTKRSFETETVMLLEVLARAAASAIATVQLKTQLDHAEQRSLRACELGGLGAWTLDTEGCALTTSLILKRQIGIKNNEPISYAGLLERVHPDDREPLRASVSHAVDHGDGFNLACRFVWPDGRVRWLDLHADVVRDSTGHVTHLCGVSSEISKD